MPAYTVQDPYLKPVELDPVDSDDELDLDLDLSDADVQELLDEFKQLNPRTVKRNLTDASMYI